MNNFIYLLFSYIKILFTSFFIDRKGINKIIGVFLEKCVILYEKVEEIHEI